MWSDRYYYLNIYKDQSLSADTDTRELIKFLDTIPELEKRGAFAFRNKGTFPFLDLILLKAENPSNWSENDSDPTKTNLITIVCGKGEPTDLQELLRVFVQIASFLGWILVDEETDDGIKHHEVWKPEDETKTEEPG